MRQKLFLGALLFVMISAQTAWDQIPQTISYQGVLMNASGIVVPDGNYALTFKLYDAATSGNLLWTETHNTVPVSNGVFNVILGSSVALNLPFDKQYWLGVTVGTDPELAPRIQLTSSPYSLNSQNGSGDGHSLDAADGDPADAVFVDNDGKVGIGTTSPAAKLDVSGDLVVSQNMAIGTGSDPLRTLKVIGSGARRALKVETFDGTPADINYRMASEGKEWFVGLVGNADFDFFDAQGLQHPLFLKQGTGNVGVGTTSPAEKLDVAGTARMTGFKLPTGAASGYVLTSDASGVGNWQPASGGADNDWTISGNDMYSAVSGNVGIGTTSPTYKLSIGGGFTDSFNFESIVDHPKLYFGRSYNTYVGYDFGGGGGFALNGWSGTGVWGRFLVDNNEVMRLTSSGSLGIGTANPAEKLDVAGIARMTGFKLPTGAASGYVLTSDAAGVGSWQPAAGGADNDWTISGNDMYSAVSGNVGIGTTNPQAKLDIEADTPLRLHLPTSGKTLEVVEADGVALKTTTPLTNLQLIANNAVNLYGNNFGARLVVGNSGSEIDFHSGTRVKFRIPMRVEAGVESDLNITGNVGIGTTSPAQKLDVAGTAQMTGFKLPTGAISGYVLTSDAAGIGSWQPASAGGGIGGSGTTNFLSKFTGSTVLGNSGIFEDGTGNVGIGMTNPSFKLDVAGGLRSSSDMVIGPGTDKTLWFNTNTSAGNLTRARVGFFFDGANNNLDLAAIDGTSNTETARVLLSQNRSITFRTNNADVARIDGTGNVGIGTTTPDTKLHVFSGATAANLRSSVFGSNNIVRVLNVSRDNTSQSRSLSGLLGTQIGIQGPGLLGGVDDYATITSVLTGNTASDLLFSVQGAGEVLRLSGSGNVGIGTTSPSEKLDVAGTARMTGFKLPTGATSGYVLTSDVTGIGTWQPAASGGIGGSGTTNFLSKFTGATTLGNSGIFEDGTGKVGVGTASPTAKLDVIGSTQPILDVVTTGGPVDNTNPIFRVFSDTPKGTPILGVYRSGNVGIGTTNPGAGLEVASNGLIVKGNSGGGPSPEIQLREAGANTLFGTLSADNNTGNIALITDNAGGILIGNNGNVGIGTGGPTAKLDVIGSSQPILDVVTTGGPGDNTNPIFRVFGDTPKGTPILSAYRSGNVGIGTTNPTSTLYVNGSFTATGTKAATVETESYGRRKLYAVESASVRFTDEGTARLQNGIIRIELDPVFAETITGGLTVHLTPYGPTSLYVAERGGNYFVVKSLDGKDVEFAWQVSARRKGYENVRLEKSE